MWGDMASVDSKLIKYPESSDSHLSRDMPPEEKEQETDRWKEGPSYPATRSSASQAIAASSATLHHFPSLCFSF